MRERLLLAVFIGGAAGGLARAALDQAWPPGGGSWPWMTFAVNIAGTALLAFVITHLPRRPRLSIYAVPVLGTGLCGALTTFSTLQLEALELVHDGHEALGVAYALVSVATGLLAAFAVTALARRGARP
jgi:fluoride exporter